MCSRHIVSLYPIDTARIGLMGTNYGGFLAMKMVSTRDRLSLFRCGVVRSPISDWGEHGMSLEQHPVQ